MKLSDVETCYKAFRGEIIRGMRITSARFGFEIEVTAKLARLHSRVAEVPISYNGRTYAEGKKIGIRDGLMALWYILKYNLLVSKKDFFTRKGLSNHRLLSMLLDLNLRSLLGIIHTNIVKF